MVKKVHLLLIGVSTGCHVPLVNTEPSKLWIIILVSCLALVLSMNIKMYHPPSGSQSSKHLY